MIFATILTFLQLLFLFILLVGFTIYFYQDNLLYYPTIPADSRTNFISPNAFHLEDFFEEIYFRTSDGVRLQAYFIKLPESELRHAPTIIYFHENAGNLSHRLQNIEFMRKYLKCNIFIVSYRGYGKSEGYANEPGLKLDAQATLDYVLSRPEVNAKKIILFGRSLGGAVALSLFQKNAEKIRGLILENSFLSIPDMIDEVMPYLSYFKGLSHNVWNNFQAVETVTWPILFVVGQKDQLVPPWHTEKLYEQAKLSKGKQIIRIPNGDHMSCWIQDGYYTHLKEFIQSII